MPRIIVILKETIFKFLEENGDEMNVVHRTGPSGLGLSVGMKHCVTQAKQVMLRGGSGFGSVARACTHTRKEAPTF